MAFADPATFRLQGTAMNRTVPFDVPLAIEVLPRFWLGGVINGVNLPRQVRHVVSVHPQGSYQFHSEVKSVLQVLMEDKVDQGMELVDGIARWAASCWADAPVLVHCEFGINRSSVVVARALMLATGMTAAEAIAIIRAKRSSACLCNPMFEEWLLNH